MNKLVLFLGLLACAQPTPQEHPEHPPYPEHPSYPEHPEYPAHPEHPAYPPDPEDPPDPEPPPPPAVEPTPCEQIPLHLENPLDNERIGEPTTTGVPFPRGALTYIENIKLVQEPSADGCDGAPVPAQFTPLIFWGDGSIKWLQVDFQPDVLAHATAIYFLQWGASVRNPTPPGLSVAETATHIVVDTGPLHFGVRRDRFTFIDFATVDGRDIVKRRNPMQRRDTWVTSRRLEYQGDVVWDGGNIFWDAAFDASYTASVELRGPMHTIILLQGWHRTGPGSGKDFDADGNHEGAFPYTIRIHAYANSRDLRIEHTFVNSRFPAREAIREIALRLPLYLGDTHNAPSARANPTLVLAGESAAFDDTTVVLINDAHGSVVQEEVESFPPSHFPDGVPVDHFVHALAHPELLTNGGLERYVSGSLEGFATSSSDITLLGRAPNLLQDSGFEPPASSWGATRVSGVGRNGSTAAKIGSAACLIALQNNTGYTMKEGYRYITRGYWKRIADGGTLFYPYTGNPTSEYLGPPPRRLSTTAFTPMELFQGPLPQTVSNGRSLIQMTGNAGCTCTSSELYQDSFYLDDFQILEIAPEVHTGFGAAVLTDLLGYLETAPIAVRENTEYTLSGAFRCADEAPACNVTAIFEWYNGGSSLGSSNAELAVSAGWQMLHVPARSLQHATAVRIKLTDAEDMVALDDLSFTEPRAVLAEGTRSALYASISDGAAGVAVFLRDGAMLYPKKLAASRDELVVSFWPDDPGAPVLDLRRTEVKRGQEWEDYVSSGQCAREQADVGLYLYKENQCGTRFADPTAMPGVGRTHELVLRFFSGENPPLRTAARAVDTPLLGFVTPEWNAQTEVIGRLLPYDAQEYRDEERILETYAEWLSQHQHVWSLEPSTRNGAQYRHAWQGMMYYGATQTVMVGDSRESPVFVPFAGRNAWLNNEHEPAHALFVAYLRSGKRVFFDVGRTIASHYADASVEHYAELGPVGLVNEGTTACNDRLETRDAQLQVGHGHRHWIDPWYGDPSSFIHTYALGMRDLYALTGQRRLADVGAEIATAMIGDLPVQLERSPLRARSTASLWRSLFAVYDLTQLAQGTKSDNRYWNNLVMQLVPDYLMDGAIDDGVAMLTTELLDVEWYLGAYNVWGYLEAVAAMDPANEDEAYWASQAAKAYGAFARASLREDGARYLWQRPKNLLLWSTAYAFTRDPQYLWPAEDDWAANLRAARDTSLAWDWSIATTLQACRETPACELGRKVQKDVRGVPWDWAKWPYFAQAWKDAGGSRERPLNRIANGDFEAIGTADPWKYSVRGVDAPAVGSLMPTEGRAGSTAAVLDSESGGQLVQEWLPTYANSYLLTLWLKGTPGASVRVDAEWRSPHKIGDTVQRDYARALQETREVALTAGDYTEYTVALTAPPTVVFLNLSLSSSLGRVLFDDVQLRLVSPAR